MQKQDSKKLGSMRLSEFRNHLLCYEYMEVVVIPAKLTHDDFCKKSMKNMEISFPLCLSI